jgi:hypothetical protein
MTIIFNGVTKIATLSAGTTSLSVTDIWSRWVDWLAIDDNSKFLPMFSLVGGDPIDAIAGTSIPFYAFLEYGWKIKPQESNHTLSVNNGILLVSGGGDPFVNTNGPYTVRVNYSQPVQAITVNTVGSGIGGPSAADIWSYSDRTLTNTDSEILAQIKGILDGISVPTSGENANAVWNKPISEITDRSTIGGYITKVLLSIPKFIGLK